MLSANGTRDTRRKPSACNSAASFLFGVVYALRVRLRIRLPSVGHEFSAERLRAARLRAGLTQSELASLLRSRDSRLKVQNQRVSGWEQGRTTPRPYVVSLLDQLLDMGLQTALAVDGLRAMRTQAGLTVREVAEAVEKTQRTVFRWERGETHPPAADRRLLAELYKVELAEIERAVESTMDTGD